VCLSLFSGAILGGIALFQVGVLKRLPDPPFPSFDADAVHGSKQAYRLLETPDALVGVASYATTGMLAGMGTADRWKTATWIPMAMAAKAVLDAAMAGRLSIEEWTRFRKFSVWSLLTAAATFGSAYLAFPEARQAWRARD
jgi:hypothetical protein